MEERTPPQPQLKTAVELLGATLMKDIEREDGSLASVLKDLRTLHPSRSSRTGIPSLDSLIPTNAKTTTISGRHLPLVYHLLQHLITDLHGTVCLLDLTFAFTPSHLRLSDEELKHIHVFSPTKATLAVTLKSLENYMLYEEASKGSRNREWVGTIVLGGLGGDFAFVWRGMLRVESDENRFAGFGAAVSVEEALAEKRRRVDAVSVLPEAEKQSSLTRGWRVVGENGSYSWRDDA